MLQKIQALRAVCVSIETSVAQSRAGVPCGRNEAQIVVQSAADLAFSLVALDAYVNAEGDAGSEAPAEDVRKEKSPGDDLFTTAKTSLEDYQGQTNERITKKLVREVVSDMKGDEPRAVIKSVTDELIGIFCP